MALKVMAGAHPDNVKYLKNKIRLFEDKKISAHALSKEVYYVAREIFDPEESGLRRALETLGNRIAAAETYSTVLDLVDEIQSELIDQGY